MNNKDESSRMWRYAPIVALLLFLCVIYVVNWCTPFASDDCSYGFLTMQASNSKWWGGLQGAWITTLQDGHRPIVHFVTRIFTGWLGETAFDLVNSAMLGLLLILMNRLAFGQWLLNIRSLILSMFLTFIVLCKGESYLWCAGSVNYLWAGTTTLAFCLLLEQVERDGEWCWQTTLMGLVAIACGCSQESFALPMCFALGILGVAHIRKLTIAKVVLYGGYALGTLILVFLLNADRTPEVIKGFSFKTLLLTQLKIWAALKGVWVLILCFVFMRNRLEMVRRNAFELLVVLGSLLMISLVGFNGERSLWCANLFAILVVVREFRPPSWLAGGLAVAMVPLCAAVIVLGVRIKANFDTFAQQFLASPDGVACHERVACGPLARFFHQALYRWQADDQHGRTYAFYHGRTEAPIALTQELYDKLYLQDSFCVPANRLPIEGAFYSTPQSNAIVMPIAKGDTTDWSIVKPKVTYAFPKGFRATLEREFARRRLLPTHGVRVLPTPHGDYLLIGKEPESDAFIRDVRLEMPGARSVEGADNV